MQKQYTIEMATNLAILLCYGDFRLSEVQESYSQYAPQARTGLNLPYLIRKGYK
jgi:hypothetical protein